MAGIRDTVLDLINTNLGEEGGIPKKKKKKDTVIECCERGWVVTRVKTGRSDLILGIRKVS